MEQGVINSKQFHELIEYFTKKGYRDINDIMVVGVARHGIDVDLLPYKYNKKTLVFKACCLEPTCINKKMYDLLLGSDLIDILVKKIAESFDNIEKIIKNINVDRRFAKRLRDYIRMQSKVDNNI